MKNATPTPKLNESDFDGYYDKFLIEDASEILNLLQRLSFRKPAGTMWLWWTLSDLRSAIG